jgi:hypothetical protein
VKWVTREDVLTKEDIELLKEYGCSYPPSSQDIIKIIRRFEDGSSFKIPPSGSPWVQSYTGKKISLLSPQPEDFDLESIAIGVSREFRFGNQSSLEYTVAQHSYYVSTLCKNYPLEGLFHDAAEGFIRDIPSPLKKLLPTYAAIEKLFYEAIADRFNLEKKLPEEVIKADKILVATECLQLMLKPLEMWSIEENPIDINLIPPWDTKTSVGMFKKRYYELTV